MEHKTRVPLMPLDVCTLMACEAVSMLDAAPDTLHSAAELRSAMTAFAVVRGLGKEGGPREELADVRTTLQIGVEPPAGPVVQQEVL